MTDEIQEIEETPEAETSEEPETFESSTDWRAEAQKWRGRHKTVLAEKKAEESRRRDAESALLAAKYPNLDPEKVKGIPLSQLDALAAAFSPPKDSGGEAAKVEALVHGSTAGSQPTFSARELYLMLQKGQITDAQMNSIIAEGRMT